VSERTRQQGSVSGTMVKVVLAIEAISLFIALALTFGPSKTGSKGGFAPLFIDEPSYLIQILINFVATNAMLTVLAAVFFIVVVRGKKVGRQAWRVGCTNPHSRCG